MKLGSGLFTTQRRPDDDRSMTAIYEELVELAGVMDTVGLDSVWVSEHHFTEDGYLSAPMPTLGAIAAATNEIEVGTCIALAPLYHPVRLAEDAATIDLLSGGRMTLGLAIGSNPREFDAFGIPRDERVRYLTEAIEVCEGAWSPGQLEYESTLHDIDPTITITPKPDESVPIMLGGAAKPAVRRAARMADGWCAPSSLSIDGVRKRVEDIRRVRESKGLEGEFQVYVLQHGWIDDSKPAAWDAMKEGYLYLQRRYREIFSGESVESLDESEIEELRDRAIFGTEAQVIDQLEEYRSALGDDIHFILRTYHPGTETEAMTTCLRRLGTKVAPKLTQ